VDSPPVPAPAYQIGGQSWDRTMPDFPEAIAKAHAHHLRPRCLCKPGAPGAEMYVARLSDGFVIKRMPNTGWQHATDCTSYEPPAEFSGLGPLVGSAIVENPLTGVTALRLDFPMTKLPGHHVQPAAGSASSSVASQGQKLGLRALLHYLWDQAELTHWKPGFAGRRNWATVRRHLLQAAENKTTHGQPLQDSLYIPEVFSVEQRDGISRRRIRQWTQTTQSPGAPQHLMLLIGEVKEISPTRFGYKVVIKHVPDQAFGVDEGLFRRLSRCFDRELALWGTSEDLHLLAIATFRLADSGIPCIIELSLCAATTQWLPIEDKAEQLLIEKLVNDERSFIKCLRYNLPASKVMPSASLTDCGASPQLLVISRPATDGADLEKDFKQIAPIDGPPPWIWQTSNQDMPSLPLKRAHRSAPPGWKSGQSNPTSTVEHHGVASKPAVESP